MSDWGEESSTAKETGIHQVMISFVENHTYLGKSVSFLNRFQPPSRCQRKVLKCSVPTVFP